MAKISDIVIRTAEYRPCIVNGENAFFHRWLTVAYMVNASPMVGGHPGGQVMDTVGLVEMEDGAVCKVAPTSIRFLDSRKQFEEYCWPQKKGENHP